MTVELTPVARTHVRRQRVERMLVNASSVGQIVSATGATKDEVHAVMRELAGERQAAREEHPQVDLAARVRGVAASLGTQDPAPIAAALLRQLSPAELHSALSQALPSFVSTVVPRHVGRDVGAVVVPSPSRKTAVVRDLVAWRLAARVQVDGSWLSLADCTAPDLRKLAIRSRQTSVRHVLRADWYGQLESAVLRHGSRTLGDVPTDDLGPLMRDQPRD